MCSIKKIDREKKKEKKTHTHIHIGVNPVGTVKQALALSVGISYSVYIQALFIRECQGKAVSSIWTTGLGGP